MSDTVKLVTDLKTYTGTLSGNTDQVLVVHNNNETVRVPFDQFKNSQTTPSVPTSPTSEGTEGDISVTEDAVYTYTNGEWGKSPRSLDWGAEYLRIDQGDVTVTLEQKDALRGRLPIAEENSPGIVPLAVDATKSYSTNYAASPTYVISYIKSLLNPENVVIGLSAYDIAVEHGFRGTEEEWLESLKCKAEDNPEQPVTMLLRAVRSVLRSTTDLQGNSRAYVYKYSVEIPNISLEALASVRLSADDCPVISPIVSLNNDNALCRGGYTVTLLRKNADIMADWWASLVTVAGIEASPDVTYLS